jgi:hypothetical protein
MTFGCNVHGPPASNKFRGLNSTYTTGIDCVVNVFNS